MGGCPIGNVIPEWNDLVYRDDWRAALELLHATNNFPEFTGYTCPAPCEPACTLAYNADAVTIKSIERAIVDKGWEMGWIVPQTAARHTGKKIAIVGSGPSGLAAAQQLVRAGHGVSVFEKDDRAGGLMTYGIPDFKFEKYQVERRLEQLRMEGVQFMCNVNIGRDVSLQQLRAEFDAVCLAIGALSQRDIDIPGRHLAGVHLGMEYLVAENRRQAGRAAQAIDARDKHVVVLGGGDTGADCVATAHRQGAKQVIQIGIHPKPGQQRPHRSPWPLRAQVYEQSYAIEEGGIEEFSLDTIAFLDTRGSGVLDALSAERVRWTLNEQGQREQRAVIESNLHFAADLVLIAIGFSGPQLDGLGAEGLQLTSYNNLKTDNAMMTAIDGVFVCGDARRGQSIVVWAIGEGRDVAQKIDTYLMGESLLPASLQTANPTNDNWEF
jgi:glutamate synthase (NADPH/NADH) small chain